jgi:hypothetical protein
LEGLNNRIPQVSFSYCAHNILCFYYVSSLKGSLKARIIPEKICGYILKKTKKAKPITPIPAVLKIMPYLTLALKHNKSPILRIAA